MTRFVLFHEGTGRYGVFTVRRNPQIGFFVRAVTGKTSKNWLESTIRSVPGQAALTLVTSGREFIWEFDSEYQVRMKFKVWAKKYSGWAKVVGTY